MVNESAVSRTDRKNRATAQLIVAVARDLLAEGGPAAVTLDAVSQRADVAIQTIYNRVGGRNAVLMAVAEQAFEANRVYMDAAYEAEGTVVERTRQVAAAYVRFALERPHEFQLLAFPDPGAPTQESVAALVREQNSKLAGLIREGIAEGVVADGLDPELAATALWRMYDGVIGLAFRPDDLRVSPELLPALMKTVEAIVESGLRSRQESNH